MTISMHVDAVLAKFEASGIIILTGWKFGRMRNGIPISTSEIFIDILRND
jgi:hypothetical protein